ncbi:MAG: hypothetical protein HY859_03450 [Caulobacterales bacterium]|nr:hypothetical protein [Caulobacterales bacterium]
MSFDVFLVAPEEEMPAEEAARALALALHAIGAALHGDELHLHDGRWIEFYGSGPGSGGMFALRGLDRSVAEAIYAVAEATSCFIVAAGGSKVAFRTPGNTKSPPEELFPQEVVEGPDELLAGLSDGHADWTAYRDQVVQSPPPAAEARLPFQTLR